MLKKHVFPAAIGILGALIFWIAVGPLIRQLPIGDAMKGLLIIFGTVAIFAIINNIISKRMRSE